MRSSAWLTIVILLVGLSGCSRSPEALIGRQIAVLDEVGEALSSITDEDSAKEAAPKLAALQAELNAMIPQVKALKLNTDEKLKTKEQEKLEDQHREAMEAALAKYSEQLARVRKLKLKVGGLSALDNAVAE
jgi:hypothetical protein